METLTGTQREQRNLRRAVQPEGNADTADATIDMQLHWPQAKPPLDILAAHRGKSQWTIEGRQIWPPCVWPQSISATEEPEG